MHFLYDIFISFFRDFPEQKTTPLPNFVPFCLTLSFFTSLNYLISILLFFLKNLYYIEYRYIYISYVTYKNIIDLTNSHFRNPLLFQPFLRAKLILLCNTRRRRRQRKRRRRLPANTQFFFSSFSYTFVFFV